MDYLDGFIQEIALSKVCISGFLILALIIFVYIWRMIRYIFKHYSYLEKAQQLIAKRDMQISSFISQNKDKVSESIQQKILNSSACELVESLKKMEITSEQILITFALRAGTIGKDLCLIADVRFFNALADCQQKDKERQECFEQGKLHELPPLHGLVLSVKDHVTCEDLIVTAGLAKAASNPKAKQDCYFVKVLKEQGVVFFCSSNVPQGIGAIETKNRIFGRALNPWNLDTTPGGSSGGEAGLVSSQCSVLGIGSDAAGSIRIPASFCGIYGFSPTFRRVSLQRTHNLRTNDAHIFREITCTYGPIGKNIDDLKLILKNIYGQFAKYDAEVPNIPFNESTYNSYVYENKKMRIGYYLDDPFCESLPGNRNAIQEVVDYLKEQGHEMILLNQNWTVQFLEVGLSIMQAHGMASNLDLLLDGEFPEEFYLLQTLGSKLPECLMHLFAELAIKIGEVRLGNLMRVIKKKNLNEFFIAVSKKEYLKDDYVDFFKQQYKLDCILSPILPYPAFKHHRAELIMPLIGSTFIYNIMQMPCGVVPIRLTNQNEQYYESKHNDIIKRILKSISKTSAGLPVCVQVASFTFDDEKCLALMKLIENKFNFHQLPPVLSNMQQYTNKNKK